MVDVPQFPNNFLSPISGNELLYLISQVVRGVALPSEWGHLPGPNPGEYTRAVLDHQTEPPAGLGRDKKCLHEAVVQVEFEHV